MGNSKLKNVRILLFITGFLSWNQWISPEEKIGQFFWDDAPLKKNRLNFDLIPEFKIT
jgi:hypothetical protein